MLLKHFIKFDWPQSVYGKLRRRKNIQVKKTWKIKQLIKIYAKYFDKQIDKYGQNNELQQKKLQIHAIKISFKMKFMFQIEIIQNFTKFK